MARGGSSPLRRMAKPRIRGAFFVLRLCISPASARGGILCPEPLTMLLADMGAQHFDERRHRGAIGGVWSGSEGDGPRRNRFGERELGATHGLDDVGDD